MGMILFAAMAAGSLAGLIITAILGGLAVAMIVKRAKNRLHGWWYFAVSFVVVLAVSILGVHEYPYGDVRGGSDYDVAMKNLFLQGAGYCAAPGFAAFLAAFAPMLAPKTT